MKMGYEWPGKGRPQLVEVEWWDCQTVAGWSTLSEARRTDLRECLTVGYVLKWTKEELLMVGTLALEKGDLDEVAEVTVIPAGWVKSVKELGGRDAGN